MDGRNALNIFAHAPRCGQLRRLGNTARNDGVVRSQRIAKREIFALRKTIFAIWHRSIVIFVGVVTLKL